MGVNENRQSGLDEAVQVGSTAAKVVEGAAKAGKITAAAANGAALGGPYGAAASVAIAAAKHGKKILLALLAILAIPLLFLVMLPTLIFGGTAQNAGDTTILNNQAAITENMNEIAFAVSDLLGSGITDAEQRIADDFAASSANQYEIVNPYEDERINNVNLFISQYCAYRDTDVAAISLEDMKQLLRDGVGELYDYTYEDETREVEETVLDENGEEVTELCEVTVRVYTLTYRGEAYFADSIFHLTTEQKTLAQNFAENLSLFLGDGLFQNLSSSESSFTIPALGNIRYTDGGTEVVYYNQLDERYANKPYGTDDIGGYGCGPTCMAMVVSSLTDDLVDPVEMAKWSYEHGYRKKEHDARKQREASLYSTAQANADAMQLLLRHVNHRISAYLKSVYPNARWEWTTGNPTALVMQGGTGRIRVYGIEEYDYADVQIDRNGNLSCNLLKVVPVQPRMDAPTPPNQQPVDPQVWYDVEGREVLERVIADLDSRGHSSLTLKEDGSVCIHEDDDTKDVPQEHLTAFPPKVYWPRLGQVLESEGLTASVQDHEIAVSW